MITWEAPDGTIYERVGDCPPEMCRGRCCEFMTFGPFSEAGPNAAEWVELHGGEVARLNGYHFVNVPMRCDALTRDGLCALYEGPQDIKGRLRERPQLCGDWPQQPSDLAMTPWCGYSFRAVAAATT